MSRETKYTAIILKKQPLNEADEIITFFTREAGKIRALAKSVKLSKSKLQNALQSLFLVNLTLAGKGSLPKIIGVQPVKIFAELRQNSDCIMRAYYACELVLKFMPDGQKNLKLFEFLSDFLTHLNSADPNLDSALAKFKAGFLSAIGLSPLFHQDLLNQPNNLKLCKRLESAHFNDLANQPTFLGLNDLQKFLSNFIVQHLERPVNSESFVV